MRRFTKEKLMQQNIGLTDVDSIYGGHAHAPRMSFIPIYNKTHPNN